MAGNRSSKILMGVLAGVIVGVLAGLWVGRDIQPTKDYTVDLTDLEEQRREDYIVLVSALYALDGDLARAEERLARLNEEDTAQLAADLATQYIEGDKGLEVIQDLATLAHALGAGDEVMLAYVVTPTHTPTSVPTMTNTPLPTPTSTETPRPTTNPTATSAALPTSTASLVPPTLTSALTPTPVPTLQPLRWDSRLDTWLHPPVRLEPAAAEPGQTYWRLVVAEWRSPDESGGIHYIYISTLDETGNPLPGQRVFVDNGGRTILVTEYKAGTDYGVTFPMYGTLGSYTCHVEGLSDRVVGLGLGAVKGAKEHTAFHLVFQRTVKR
ncbi:MAG: hypothetical protein E3J21_02950 [Anaerolineales bacterium]|nr:MAG: hypothetical protein E3J21_02950 [Anaerolineales bacterium]